MFRGPANRLSCSLVSADVNMLHAILYKLQGVKHTESSLIKKDQPEGAVLNKVCRDERTSKQSLADLAVVS